MAILQELSFFDSNCKCTKLGNLLILCESIHEKVCASDGLAVCCPTLPCLSFTVMCSSRNRLLTGNCCSSEISQQLILLGMCNILKWFGIWFRKREHKIEVRYSLFLCHSCERASATLFLFPANHWLYPFMSASKKILQRIFLLHWCKSMLRWGCCLLRWSLIFSSSLWLLCCLSSTVHSPLGWVVHQLCLSTAWLLPQETWADCLTRGRAGCLEFWSTMQNPNCCSRQGLGGMRPSNEFCRGSGNWVSSYLPPPLICQEFLASTLNRSCNFC